MKFTLSSLGSGRAIPATLLLTFVFFGSQGAAAQGPVNSLAKQREAMHKLSFLSGRWSGPATVVVGPGRTLHIVQTENVQYKLGGLVLLIEGSGKDANGKEVFSALATIAYDEASHQYRFRAYNGGRYLDTQLSVAPDGFSWSFTAGPAHVVNRMHLTAAGEWQEVTETTFGGAAPHRSVEMALRHLQ